MTKEMARFLLNCIQCARDCSPTYDPVLGYDAVRILAPIANGVNT
jgi:hypothetical protein